MSAVNHAQFTAVDAQIESLVLSSAITAPVSVPWPQRTTDLDDVAATAPTAGQVLAFDGVGSEWAPATLAVAAVKDSIFISASEWTSGGATSPAVRHWATVSTPQYNGAGATTFTVSTDASNGGEKYITLNQAGQYTVFASSDKTTDDESWLQIDQRNAAGAIVQSVRSDDNAAALGIGHRFSLKPLFNCIATDTLHVSIRNLSVVGGAISTTDNANFLSIVREGDMVATPRVVTHQEAVLSLSPSPFIYYPLDTDSSATLVSLGSLGTGYNATIDSTCYSERHIRQRPTANGGKVLDIGAHYPVETHRIYCDGTVNTAESLMPSLGSDSWGCSLWFRFSNGAALTAARTWFVAYGHQVSVALKSRGMGFTPDGNVWVGAQGIFNSYSTGSVDIGDGRWHHMAGHVSGKITVCYLDGVLIGTTGFNSLYLDAVNGTPIVIGGEEAYLADTHFIGELSHIALRKAPWTQDEVSLLYSKRPVEDDEGATTLGLRVEYDASDVDGAGTPAATTGATQSIVNLAWPGTHDGTMYNSSGTTAVADAGMSTTSHPWAFSFARAAGAGDSRIEFADSYSMSFNDASTNYMTAEFVLRFTSLASAQRLFAEIGTGGERHNLGVLTDGSIKYEYSDAAVHYRADNVDGAGTPGNGSTTTLVNLANPGTYDATIINGTGVSRDPSKAGTPYEYAINMTENATYGLGSFLRVGGLGTNFTFSSELYHTVELWLLHDGTTTQMYAECVNGSADYKNARYFSSGADLYHQHYSVASGSNNVFVGTTSFPSTKTSYNQIVFVRNGTTYSYYINGALSLSNTSTALGTYNGAAPNLTYIGAIYSSVASPNMNGKLCVAKLYDRALDADEIAQRYDAELLAGPQVVTANTWQHIAAVTDDGNLTVYYDGSVAHTGPYEGSTTLSALTTTLIGTASGDTDAFNCDIALARFYNRPLSTAEVQANYVAAMRTDVVPQPVAGAMVYYRADNVDGAGNPGSGATTTLVNLANPGTYNGTINNSAAGVVSQPDLPSPWNYGISLDTVALGTSASHVEIGDGFLTSGGEGNSANIRSTHEFWLLPTDLPGSAALGYLYGEVNTPTDTVLNVNYFLTESFLGSTFAIAHTPDGSAPLETYSANNVWKYNQFVQIVIVNDGGTLTFYVDGSSVGSVAIDAYTGRVTTGCTARLGCRGDALSNTIFEGTMSAVLIYDRVLSATEVALNYATLRGEGSSVPGAVVYYRADNVDGVGTPGGSGTTSLVNLANPGTYDGTINTPATPAIVTTAYGPGYGIDLNASSIEIGGPFFLNGGVNSTNSVSATVELWWYFTATDTATRHFYFEYNGSGHLRHSNYVSASTPTMYFDQFPNTGGQASAVASSSVSNEYIQFVMVNNSGTLTWYKNGAQIASTTGSEVYAGTALTGSRLLGGAAAIVTIARIYNTALTAPQVYANYLAEINA